MGPMKTDPTPEWRAQPDYEMMDDMGEWAVAHYVETHGRKLGEEDHD